MLPELRNERGQTIILGAFFIATTLVLLAVVLYIGGAYAQRRDLQNVADAAALAGAQELDGTAAGEPLAIAAAKAWAVKNNADLDAEPEVTVGDSYTSVTVRARRTPGFSFPMFGLVDKQISARAKAQIMAPLLPGPGVVPVSIPKSTFDACVGPPVNPTACNGVTLKEWSGNNSAPSSAFQWINIDGTGSGNICDYLQGGSTTSITDPVQNRTGNISSAAQCLQTRMDAASGNFCLTDGDVTLDDDSIDPRCNPLDGASRNANGIQPTAVIVIPIVKSFPCNGAQNCQLDIVGDDPDERQFAYFLIDLSTVKSVNGVGPTCGQNGGGGGGGSNPPPGQCWITGRFLLSFTAPLDVTAAPTGDFIPGESLIKVVRLVE